MSQIIDFKQFIRTHESEGVSRQQHVERETRPQNQKEAEPDWYKRVQSVRAQQSDFGGGPFAGRTWGGGRER
jgi:hypothetical protein